MVGGGGIGQDSLPVWSFACSPCACVCVFVCVGKGLLHDHLPVCVACVVLYGVCQWCLCGLCIGKRIAFVTLSLSVCSVCAVCVHSGKAGCLCTHLSVEMVLFTPCPNWPVFPGNAPLRFSIFSLLPGWDHIPCLTSCSLTLLPQSAGRRGSMARPGLAGVCPSMSKNRD